MSANVATNLGSRGSRFAWGGGVSDTEAGAVEIGFLEGVNPLSR